MCGHFDIPFLECVCVWGGGDVKSLHSKLLNREGEPEMAQNNLLLHIIVRFT